MDTDGFIVHVKTEGIYKMVKKYLTLQNKKVIGLMKDGVGRQILD